MKTFMLNNLLKFFNLLISLIVIILYSIKWYPFQMLQNFA